MASSELKVLLAETASVPAQQVAEALADAGHTVTTCHGEGDVGIACAALRGGTCPLEDGSVDVVVLVRPEARGEGMLLEQGALDVTMTPLLMKKNRQATQFTVICKPEAQERLAQIVLDETSTLGLRIYSAERRVQSRTFVEVTTPYGPVKMKVSGTTASPEYDDCRQLAIKTGVPLKDILTEANFAWLKSRR